MAPEIGEERGGQRRGGRARAHEKGTDGIVGFVSGSIMMTDELQKEATRQKKKQ
jgi:hypothetical protein